MRSPSHHKEKKEDGLPKNRSLTIFWGGKSPSLPVSSASAQSQSDVPDGLPPRGSFAHSERAMHLDSLHVDLDSHLSHSVGGIDVRWRSIPSGIPVPKEGLGFPTRLCEAVREPNAPNPPLFSAERARRSTGISMSHASHCRPMGMARRTTKSKVDAASVRGRRRKKETWRQNAIPKSQVIQLSPRGPTNGIAGTPAALVAM
ncbi:hypothetical protein B0I35DRAFT_29042 [Stachybotrys elegans]|uniref:Uncharacterized protein n=1 Tax=Stachybotrys elegans TaxID=80388 RepID=A0A8K0WWN0_9HYPO|nr:hypothetical protein B0I35DRAFT_29042 [Stachybotrys elegans]